jgi:predicted DNA binding protein
MWVLKLELDSEKQFLGAMAIKNNITMSGYPISSSEIKTSFKVMNCGLMFGSEENKINLINDFKKSNIVTNLEVNQDFVIIQMKVPKYMKPFFHPEIIQVSPVLINPNVKKHRWILASFKRKLLEKVLQFAKEKHDAKLLKFKQEKINNISISSILPSLSKKQYEAFNLAVVKGYYEFPKKIYLKTLAKQMNISYSTYQEHLKKAESKLLPSILN